MHFHTLNTNHLSLLRLVKIWEQIFHNSVICSDMLSTARKKVTTNSELVSCCATTARKKSQLGLAQAIFPLVLAAFFSSSSIFCSQVLVPFLRPLLLFYVQRLRKWWSGRAGLTYCTGAGNLDLSHTLIATTDILVGSTQRSGKKGAFHIS